MAELLLGPVLRYVSEREATVWVETGEPCEVEILGFRESTFTVEEHHYALVRVQDLEPASLHEYEVALDGARRWPPPDSDLPPSTIRTLGPEEPIDVCFGSCRVALPHVDPYVQSKDEHGGGREFDALRVLAAEMAHGKRDQWPELLFLLGDQVYVDEGAPQTRERIRRRRGTDTPPGEEVTDFQEYSWLYEESWSDPLIRWLLSTVSVSMVWDDHDMSDDWNISHSWLAEMNRRSWWQGRITAGVMSYWIYQHLGNLSPAELDDDPLYREVRGNPRATGPLREHASRISTSGHGVRWSFSRDLGRTRVLFLDSRAGRVVEPERRAMVDDAEWSWVEERSSGDFDHLLIATTIPFLLSPGFHHLEAWSERVCAGAWGRPAAWLAERMRRALDFDHWASFGESFGKLRGLIEEVGAGRRGAAPATITVLSGDVHHAYLAEMGFAAEKEVESVVCQAVCSPYRNPLERRERLAIRSGFSRPFTALTRRLARAAGAAEPGLGWRLAEGPFFDNQVMTMRLQGRRAELKLDKTVPGERHEREMRRLFRRRLA